MTSGHLSLFFMRFPFQPIRLFLVDGRMFDIMQPDFAGAADAGSGVWVFYESGEIELIDGSLISSIRTIGAVDLDDFTRVTDAT
ncbi:MAG TPA: hypothetical protein VGI81_00220 [Tepidisphaeraceae bacterium]|jgi:hypothetical protein